MQCHKWGVVLLSPTRVSLMMIWSVPTAVLRGVARSPCDSMPIGGTFVLKGCVYFSLSFYKC